MPELVSDKENPPPKSRRWLRWARDLLILAVLFALVQWWQSRDLIQGAAPPLVGHLVDGQPYQLQVADGPTLVHFWAEWCPICRLEEGNIDRLAGDLPVITVATTSGTAEEVIAYLQRQGLSMPTVLDESGEIARAWGVNGVPASFIVDRSGAIVSAGMGYSTEWGLRLRLWWSRAFGPA